jgi:histidinol-phosphate aminotransferase
MRTFQDIANSWVADLATYEPGRPIEEVGRELGFESIEDIIKLASNENALGPSPMAVEAMQRDAERMHYYPDGGAFYLKQAIADKLNVSSEQVLPVNGSNEAIELLAHVFLGPETSIVMAEHAFVVYRLIAASCRADVVSVPMKEFVHDLDAMLNAIDDSTRIVFISNPNNPTSTMVDEEAIASFMERVPDHVVVCFDEAYIELLDPSRCPDTLKYVREGKKVVVLRTFSKTYGLAGLRIGYAVADKECINLLNRMRQPFNVNAMALSAARAALGDDDHVRQTRKMVQEGLSYFEGELKRMGIDYVAPVANFILIKVGQGRELFEALKKKGFIIRHMDGYGLPEYVRITVGRQKENELLAAAIGEVLGK